MFIQWLKINKRLTRIDTKYPLVLDTVLANLWDAQRLNKQLITPRDRDTKYKNNVNKLGYQLVNNAVDFLDSKGFLILHKGKPSEFDSIATWCTASPLLLYWFDSDDMRTKLDTDSLFVELRKKIKGENETVEIPPSKMSKARRLSKPAKAHNLVWTNHTLTLNGDYARPWLRRVFNESLDLGGRFYGFYQTLTKQNRAKLKIDNVPTLEPDFSGLHFNLMYAEKGVQFDNINDDVYTIARLDGKGNYDRDLIKSVSLPLMNTTSLKRLAAQISNSGSPAAKNAFKVFKAKKDYYDDCTRQGIKCSEPKKMKGFIEGIPEGTNGRDLLDAIKAKHHVIADLFGTENLSIRLQNKDSQIMGNIITELSKRHIPVLPVHDSVRCKVSDNAIVTDIMLNEYQKITGFKAHIKCPRSLNHISK